jgi:membrane associated rhomboid family serine protease
MKEKTKQLIANCLDDRTKAKNKLNKNYFFISTIFFIALNITIFAIFGVSLAEKYWVKVQDWDSILNFSGLFSAILNNLSHFSWEHVLLNMLTFFIISVYLERKFGSLKHFLIILLSIVMSAAFVSGNHQSLNYAGWSCVNFALMGFFIVSYFFSLNRRERTNENLIYGTITFIAVFVSMWWEIWTFVGETASAADLIHNMGHYSGFLAGIIIGLTIYLTRLFVYKSQNKNIGVENQSFAINKIVYIVCILISILLCIASIVIACVIH